MTAVLFPLRASVPATFVFVGLSLLGVELYGKWEPILLVTCSVCYNIAQACQERFGLRGAGTTGRRLIVDLNGKHRIRSRWSSVPVTPCVLATWTAE